MNKGLIIVITIIGIVLAYGLIEYLKNKKASPLDIITGLFIMACAYLLICLIMWIKKENE